MVRESSKVNFKELSQTILKVKLKRPMTLKHMSQDELEFFTRALRGGEQV